MQINKYLWNNYLNNNGNSVIRLFQNLIDIDSFFDNYDTIEEELSKVHLRFFPGRSELKYDLADYKDYTSDFFVCLRENIRYKQHWIV